MSDYELNRLGRLSHPVFLAADASHYRSFPGKMHSKIARALKATEPRAFGLLHIWKDKQWAPFLYQAFITCLRNQ